MDYIVYNICALINNACFICKSERLYTIQSISLAGRTPNREGKGGLVTSRTTTCAARQDSGATNHLRGFEMRGVTSSNARY